MTWLLAAAILAGLGYWRVVAHRRRLRRIEQRLDTMAARRTTERAVRAELYPRSRSVIVVAPIDPPVDDWTPTTNGRR